MFGPEHGDEILETELSPGQGAEWCLYSSDGQVNICRVPFASEGSLIPPQDKEPNVASVYQSGPCTFAASASRRYAVVCFTEPSLIILLLRESVLRACLVAGLIDRLGIRRRVGEFCGDLTRHVKGKKCAVSKGTMVANKMCLLALTSPLLLRFGDSRVVVDKSRALREAQKGRSAMINKRARGRRRPAAGLSVFSEDNPISAETAPPTSLTKSEPPTWCCVHRQADRKNSREQRGQEKAGQKNAHQPGHP